jgi:hypothetical protein
MMLSLCACSSLVSLPGEIESEDPGQAEDWQAAVSDLKRMTRGMTIPGHLTDPDLPPVDAVFDPNQLLLPLPHLSLRPGYTLDFVYYYDGTGGRPFLYARKIDDPPYESLDAYTASLADCEEQNDSISCSFLDYVDVDGTPEGYFQWVLLDMMGGQFYLYWHSGYDDAEIIASQGRLEELVDELSTGNFGIPLTRAQKRSALQLDPTPTVTIEGDIVTVRVLWFTRWGGFNESVYTITRSAPHEIMGVEESVLLEYDCGIMF